MAWEVVKPLEDLRHQLNAVAPDRDKASDGSIGDTSHAAGSSSHNPDKTGNPEHEDGDVKDEVRARDFDKDLRHPDLTMEQLVQHLVEGARSGTFWWLRYIIYNGRMWHKNTGWQTRSYTGTNKHTEHAHVNSDFTQAADSASANYRLEEIVALTAAQTIDAVLDALETPRGLKVIGRAVHDYVTTNARKNPDGTNPPVKVGDLIRWMDVRADRTNALVAAVEAKADAVLKNVVEDDAKLTAIQAQVDKRAAELVAHQNAVSQNEASREQTTRQEEQLRHSQLVELLSNVDEEVVAAILQPGNPNEEVAEALLSLMGDRAPELVQIMASKVR